MHRPILAFALVLLGWLALLAPAQAEPQFPSLVTHANDYANILSPAQETELDNKLSAFERETGRQVVVVTLPDLQGYDIADYGYQLGRHWAIGRKGLNDGAILIVAPKERKVRIEVGYGLESTLTDGISSLIINERIVPRFKDGDMPGGIEAGVDQILAQVKLPPEEAQRLARQAAADNDKAVLRSTIISWTLFVCMIGFFVLIIWVCCRGSKGERYAGGSGPAVTTWGSSDSSSSWSSSDSWSSSSDFSGGGGDFGGGGASGDW